MSRLIANHGWELDLKVQGVFGRWAELVGDEVADHCTPESFADGRLVVRTDSTAWATQLKLLTPTVVRRLNEELGHGTVDRDRGARPPPAELDQGPALEPRRAGSARHLRLSGPGPRERRSADLRASATGRGTHRPPCSALLNRPHGAR